MSRQHSRSEILGTLLRTSVFLRPYKPQLACVFLLIFAVSLLSLVFPALTGWIVDFSNGNDPKNMAWLRDLIIPKTATGWSAIFPPLIFFGVLLFARAGLYRDLYELQFAERAAA
jgi:ABC-type multidrug transport system fused ATPase/permease subunit